MVSGEPNLAKKYTFDVDFKEEQDRARAEKREQMAERERQIAEAEAEAAKLRMSPEEIEQLKTTAFEKGRVAGAQDVTESHNQASLDTLNTIMQKLSNLTMREKNREEAMKRVAMTLAFDVIKKMIPGLMTGYENDAIEALVKEVFHSNPDEARLVIRVHDNMLDDLIEKIDRLSADTGFNGKPIILADKAIQPGDCSIEWADGGLERNTQKLIAGLQKAIDRLASGMTVEPTIQEPAKSEDSGDEETPNQEINDDQLSETNPLTPPEEA